MIETSTGMMAAPPMRLGRVARGAGLAAVTAWPLLAAVLTYTHVAEIWGGGQIGVDPASYYWIFLTAFSASLILFAESVRRWFLPGVWVGVVYLCFWAIGGWAVAVLPPAGL